MGFFPLLTNIKGLRPDSVSSPQPLTHTLPHFSFFTTTTLTTITTSSTTTLLPKMDFQHSHSDNPRTSAIHPPEKHRIHESKLDYSNEPTPTRLLSNYIVHCHTPFNAEPQLPLLVNSGQITPADVFFKRNHGPIPDIALDDHKIFIGVQQNPQYYFNAESPAVEWKQLSMHDIMSKWPKTTITASLQCAGNRRDGLAAVKEVKGVIWGAGTTSTAVWSGPRLCDVLRDVAGVSSDMLHEMIRDFHVSFEADDHVHEDVCYGSSIPLRKAMYVFFYTQSLHN